MSMEFSRAATSSRIGLIADKVENEMGYPVGSDVTVMLTETDVGDNSEVGDWLIALPLQTI